MIGPDPSDLEGRIAMATNAIVGEAMSEAFKWLIRREFGKDYKPPLFLMPGVELPIVPRLRAARLDGPPKPPASAKTWGA